MKSKREELQNKTSSIRLLRDIAIASNEARVPEEAFQFALEKISLFGGWSLAHVFWCDEDRPDHLISTELWYRKDPGLFEGFLQHTRQLSFHKGVGMPGKVLETRKPYIIRSTSADLVPFRATEAQQAGLRSAFALPVMIGPEVAAVIEFFSPDIIEMDEEVQDLMLQVGTQLGRVIERKRSEERIQQQSLRLNALAELSRLLAEAETDTQRTLDAIARRVTELVGDTCTIALLSADGLYLNAAAYYHADPQALKYLNLMTQAPRPAGEGDQGRVMRSGKPLRLDQIDQDELRATCPPEYLPYLQEFGLHALAIVPLRFYGQSIGTLTVSRDTPGRPYSQEDVEFLQELGDRAALAINNARLFDRLEQELLERKEMEAELTELQRLIMDSVDLERLRLAKKLHDDAIQGLYGVIFTLEGLRDSLGGEADSAQIRLVTRELQQVINRLQGTFKELSPPTLVPFGLDKAIGAFIENFLSEKPEYRISMDLEPEVRLSERVGYTLFRIFHQIVENIVQHARADQIHVRLAQDRQQVVLEIQDNGSGFSPPKRWIDMMRQGRYGLARQSERAEAIGGKLKVESRLGEGTRVRISIPIFPENLAVQEQP